MEAAGNLRPWILFEPSIFQESSRPGWGFTCQFQLIILCCVIHWAQPRSLAPDTRQLLSRATPGRIIAPGGMMPRLGGAQGRDEKVQPDQPPV